MINYQSEGRNLSVRITFPEMKRYAQLSVHDGLKTRRHEWIWASFHSTSKALVCKNNPYFNLPAKPEQATYKLGDLQMFW